MKELLYTIGHSNQSIKEFINLLELYKINCIIDVRSVPYSKYTPQFNEDSLSKSLKGPGILYVPFGEHFGARRFDCLKEEEFITKGKKEKKKQVNFEIGITTTNFLLGVERLKNAISQGRTIAFMCSEADPLTCHRFSFISRYFYDIGWEIQHIVKDKTTGESRLESHQSLEQKMISDYESPQKEYTSQMTFGNEYDNQLRIRAYRLKNREIGWRPDDNNDSNEIENH